MILECRVDETGGSADLAAAEALLTAAHGAGRWVVDEYVFHDDCWIIQWLEAGDLYDTAEDDAFDHRVDVDDDLRWPNGVIKWEWQGDYLTWTYASIEVTA